MSCPLRCSGLFLLGGHSNLSRRGWTSAVKTKRSLKGHLGSHHLCAIASGTGLEHGLATWTKA